jgi:enterochelin esterase-like enzyme
LQVARYEKIQGAHLRMTPGKSIRVESIDDFYSFQLSNTRRIDIHLPPDYGRATDVRYPVLYLNDGQDALALHLAETLARLSAARKIDPIIAVAIHATADRMNEYGISNIPNAVGRGARAAAYAQFLIDELVPFIDRTYRTQSDAPHTALFGSSLGGLSAFDIAWYHSLRVGCVGACSASFWWRTDNSTRQAQQATRIAHQIVRAGPKRSGLRFWFETGTADEAADRDRNGVIDAIQDTLELMDALQSIGYRRDRELHYHEIKGGQHHQATWAQALPVFLQWAFPPSGNRLRRWLAKWLK